MKSRYDIVAAKEKGLGVWASRHLYILCAPVEDVRCLRPLGQYDYDTSVSSKPLGDLPRRLAQNSKYEGG